MRARLPFWRPGILNRKPIQKIVINLLQNNSKTDIMNLRYLFFHMLGIIDVTLISVYPLLHFDKEAPLPCL